MKVKLVFKINSVQPKFVSQGNETVIYIPV